MIETTELSPAKAASKRALQQVYNAIMEGLSFKLEAGAGAGKTYSLVKTLHFLIQREGKRLTRRNQRIACITFTNVAKDEIETRTDSNPVIHCDTIHAFCWSAISGFQAKLREHLPELERWAGDLWSERLADAGGIGKRKIEYSLGHRGINDNSISVHHSDVLLLAIKLLGYEKFRNIFRFRYPFILIDEYQDTDADLITALSEHFLGKDGPPLFGFFGDHWQKIYGNGCGEITDSAVTTIDVKANFRSVLAIVDCLNKMRPELPQFVGDPNAPGDVHVFHTNEWSGDRLTGPHYGGDLPDEEVNSALEIVHSQLTESEWDFSPDYTKILMLTHRALGKQQGYSSLPTVFSDNNSFTNKEQPHIAFFADQLEPACRAFANKRYGEMFAAFGINRNYISKAIDKKHLSESMERLIELRELGTVADVIEHLRNIQIPRLSEAAEYLEVQLEAFDSDSGEEMPRPLRELQKLHEIQYHEIISLVNYLEGHSPFETQHGVKGAEFDNVLVIMGRGWNQYNFVKMLENVPQKDALDERNRATFERNRNLFYVACSRPKKRLALLFTQKLSSGAMGTVENWFGRENIYGVSLE